MERHISVIEKIVIQNIVRYNDDVLLKIREFIVRKGYITMARTNKEYKNLNCKIEKSIADKLEKMCDKTKLTKTAIVENALLMYMQHYDKTGRI